MPTKILYVYKTQERRRNINDKQNMVYPWNGILFSHRNNELIHGTMWMNLENLMLSERASHRRPHIA
jgi:hypothetical protein